MERCAVVDNLKDEIETQKSNYQQLDEEFDKMYTNLEKVCEYILYLDDEKAGDLHGNNCI